MRGRDLSLWSSLALPLLLAASGGACGPHGGHWGPGPQLMVTFIAAPTATPALALTAATMTLEHVQVIGNGSGPSHGGTDPSEDHVTFDLLGVGDTVTQTVSPGLYSRIEFNIDGCAMSGSWNGTPFAAMLAKYEGARVDVRAATPVEVLPGDEAAQLTVTVDPNLWFAAPSPLDEAAVGTDGTITCNDQQNETAAKDLTARLPGSFTLK